MRVALIAALLLLRTLHSAATGTAILSKACPRGNVCYSLNIPGRFFTTGRGEIYFQIRATSDHQWVALGQGTQMAGANMFVVYQDSTGTNVTLSTRLGKSHVQPLYSKSAEVTLLQGSGIENGWMAANVRCDNCQRWPGGSMDWSGTHADWLYAWKTGEPLLSDDVEATINQHDHATFFSWPLTNAKGGNELNPFLPGAGISRHTTSTSDKDWSDTAHLTLIHGGLASLVFVILFPAGGILIRLANFRGGVWVHVGLQALAWLATLVALPLGLYLAIQRRLMQKAAAHPIIGIVILFLILGQPLYGYMHHRAFRQHGQRTGWSWAHIVAGRVAIFAGMINGGLGIQLSGLLPRKFVIAYGVVSGVLGLLYFIVIVYGERRLNKGQRRGTPPGRERLR